LITGISELEIRRGRRELVYKLIDSSGEPRIFITLQIGLQVILRKALVDLLWWTVLNKPLLQRTCTYLGERILLISIFVSKLPGISYDDYATKFAGNHIAYPRLV
jgi:hypothetical protein